MMTHISDPILGPLNEPQRQAAIHHAGPALILAGAGSGKTRALTHRIARLMKDGVQPWQILAVTFTNKAANEMKERIKNLLHIVEGSSHLDFARDDRQSLARLPVMGTFHSICARILRKDIERLGRNRNFVIYDTDDQEKLMKEVLKELQIDENTLKPRPALGYIGRFKSEAMNAKDALKDATTERMIQVIRAYETYDKMLRAANAVDFDDLILETVRLFNEVPEVLSRYQETWRFLHVDEYQDTNHAQYLFISQLAQKYRNLCVIGDPDQSIYAFRGADVRNILEFEQEYPDALRIALEQNYRSTQVILDASNAVIKSNPRRPKKNMWTKRKGGPTVIVHEVRDERKEAEEAAKAAQFLKKDGVPLNHQVVLYRTNAQSRLFEEACMRAGIPYRIVGGTKFYTRREVKDVLAYLYVILNPADTISLLRILNVPARKIGEATLGHIQAFASQESLTLWDALIRANDIVELNDGVKTRIEKFISIVKQLRTRSSALVVSELAAQLLDAVGLEKWLRDDLDEGEERWQNVQELLTVMHKYDQLDPQTSLTSFLEEVALISEVDKLTSIRDDALTLMTLHLCKGLEFEHVMIAGCEEGIFPHSSSMFDKEQLEEERRLMYVGMTRARTHLRIFFTRSRQLWGNTQANAPSRFIADLPSEAVERRSDELLSAFAWATESGRLKAAESHTDIQPYRQRAELNVEFNQDLEIADGMNQDVPELRKGSRVRHPSFGEGTVLSKRGDVATIVFDSGKKKDFALSIAPLQVL
ncbi:UvrD-helicase domain-containing protein [Candidatus Peregrinibacteria bacterium]|nr:UvrD-helicase domain-containing protein [Candidatus Peregrinibacteria bacterium]